MLYTVYRTENLVTGEYYVGAHATENPDDEYLGSGVNLSKNIVEYGSSNFKKSVLFVFNSSAQMFDKEKELVTFESISHPLCLNIIPGGKGATKGCPEHKSRVSASIHEKWKNLEYRRKCSSMNKERSFSSLCRENYQKYRKSEKGRLELSLRSKEMLKDPERRKKISEGMKKSHRSGERDHVPEKIRAILNTPEIKEKIRAGLKRAKESGKMDAQKMSKAISYSLRNSVKVKERGKFTSNSRWVTDGSHNLRIQREKLEEFLSKGWKEGRASRS